MDTESVPMKECSGIEVDAKTYKILDVYHKYADSEELQPYARKHVHGLNKEFLQSNGFPTEAELIADFKAWLDSKPYRVLYANDPTTEIKLFETLEIENLCLPPWRIRYKGSYHIVAHRFKTLYVPILNTACCYEAHRDFRCYPKATSDTQIVKNLHGHHCSLYDAYELYLFFLVSCLE